MQGCLLHQMPSVLEGGCCKPVFLGHEWIVALERAQQEKPHSY